jgi:hypothetical protein
MEELVWDNDVGPKWRAIQNKTANTYAVEIAI